ncbi:MAG: nucleotidyltransferase family protein [Candidatus Binatia bacterium]
MARAMPLGYHPAVDDFDAYIAAWRARWAREREEDGRAAAAARALAGRLAEVLGDRYGARRVILAGSLARGEFHRGSDIDLAVEGLPTGELFRAGAALEESARGLEVDLVPIESASPEYVARLEREGITLYEHPRA